MFDVRKSVSFLLAFLLLVSAFPLSVFSNEADATSTVEPAEEAETDTVSSDTGFAYVVSDDGTASISGYQSTTGKDPTIVIPEQIDGYRVTRLAEEALAYHTEVEAVVVPASVTQIDNAAFYHCESLKIIAFLGETVSFDFTVVEGCRQLEKVLALKSCDLTAFCSILVSDLGEAQAEKVEIMEFEDLVSLQKAFDTYTGTRTFASIQASGGTVGVAESDFESETEAREEESETETSEAETEAVSGSEDEPAETEPSIWLDGRAVQVIQPHWHASIDYVNEKGPNGSANYSGVTAGAVLDCRNDGIRIGEDLTVSIGGWLALEGGVDRYIWSVDGMNWHTVTAGGRDGEPLDGYYANKLGFGYEALQNGMFNEADILVADLSAYVDRESVDVMFAAVSAMDTTKITPPLVTLTDLRIAVTGDFVIEDGILVEYSGKDDDVIIPDGVTGIAANVFSGKDTLHSVTLPDSLVQIGYYAFYNCCGLTEISIPDGVTSIGDRAFASCSSLTSVILSEQLTSIGAYVFADCSSLQAIDLPDGIAYIPDGAFSNCGMLSRISLPDSLDVIGNYAFRSCTGLTELSLPDGVTRVGYMPFAGCSALKTVFIPNGISEFGTGAFEDCTALSDIRYDGTAEQWDAISDRYIWDENTGYYTVHFSDGTSMLKQPRYISHATDTFLVNGQSYFAYDGSAGNKLEELDHSLTLSLDTEGIALRGWIGFTMPIISFGYRIDSGELVTGDFFEETEQNVLNAGGRYASRFRIEVPTNDLEAGTYSVSFVVLLEGGTEYVLETISVTLAALDADECTPTEGLSFRLNSDGLSYTVTGLGTAVTAHVVIPSLYEGLPVTHIGSYAFDNSLLASVVIPDSVTEIGYRAFYDCIALTSMTIPDSVTAIDDYAFYRCTSLQSLTLSNSLLTLGAYAFAECTALQSLALPNTLTTIDNYTFQNCLSLTGDLIIPNSVTSIGYCAFDNCTGFNGKLILSESLEIIDRHAFYNCSGMTGDLIIPNSVTQIGYNAFRNCTGFNGKLILSDSLETIGEYAFYNCSGIDGELVIPSSVTKIDRYAFYGMTGLTSVVVHGYVENVGSYPFEGCTGIKSMTFSDATPSHYRMIYGMSNSLRVVFVPEESMSAYQSSYNNYLPSGAHLMVIGSVEDLVIDGTTVIAYLGDGGEVVIPDGVTSIASYAFYGCKSVTKLTLPEGLTTIEQYAFYNCTGLVGTLILPSTVTSIGSYAFAYCSGITGELVIPSGVTSLSNRSFAAIPGLTSVIIGENVRSVSSCPFLDCTGIKSMTILATSPISTNVFYGIGESLEVLYVPMESFSKYASSYTNSLPINTRIKIVDVEDDFIMDGSTLIVYQGEGGEVVIPDGVTSIGPYAFSRCRSMTKLTLPEGLTTIEQYAFYNCTGLVGTLILPSTVTSIGSYAFYNCEGLNGQLILSESLKTIGSYAFAYCSSLVGELIIPSGVTSVEYYAFAYMTGLTSVILGENVQYVSYPFSGSTAIVSLTVLSEKSLSDSLYIGIGDALESIYVTRASYALHAKNLAYNLPTNTRLKVIGVDSDFVIDGSILVAYQGKGGEVTVPDGVTAIGAYAFQGNKAVTKVALPAGLTSIGEYAFYHCESLTEIAFGGTEESIGRYAFGYCYALQSLTLPETLQTIGGYAFYHANAMTGDLVIPSCVTSIGDNAFAYCSGLKTLTLPESLTEIGSAAFYYCSGITGELVIPNQITRLNGSTFAYMSAITSVVIGEKVQYVNSDFYGCSSVTHMTFLGTAFTGGNVFSGLGASLEAVYVPLEGFASFAEHYTSNLPANARLRVIGSEGDFVMDGTTLVIYQGLDEEVTVPDGVTAIAPYAFRTAKSLTKVILPVGLTTIEDHAFYQCKNLVEVVFAGTEESIGAYAFYECTSLQALTLSDSLQTIGNRAFYRCQAITGSLVIPNSVTSIGEYAFYSCTGLNGTLTLSAALTTIGHRAFAYCPNIIGELTIPAGMTYLGSEAFRGVSGLTALHVFGEGGVMTVWYDSFYDCTGIKTVTFYALNPPHYYLISGIGSSVETIYVPQESYDLYVEKYASHIPENATFKVLGTDGDFVLDGTILQAYQGSGGEVTIPAGVTAIGERAFQDNTTVTKIILPAGLTSIGAYAFHGCTALTEIVFAGSETAIGAYAFYACTALQGLSLPASLQTIGARAFVNCTGMTGDLIIPNSVTTIGEHAFDNCSGLDGKLVLSESLTKIEGYAFSGCTGITGELCIPATVTSIGYYAFQKMTSLASVVVEGKVDTLQYYPFADCTGIKTMTFCHSGSANWYWIHDVESLETLYVPMDGYVTYVREYIGYVPADARFKIIGVEGDFVLDGTTLVTYQGNGGEVTLPEGVTVIGPRAFQSIKCVTKVTLPDGLVSIGDYAFHGCTALSEIVFANSETSIGAYAFHGCTALQGLSMPASLQTIGNYAFYACTGLSGDLVIPNGVTTIGDHAFRNCTGLNGALTLSSALEKIGAYAFEGCTGITGELTLPAGVTSIGMYAFRKTLLTSVVVEGRVTNVSSYEPFSDCVGITTITFCHAEPSSYYLLYGMAALETVYVPAESFDIYIEAFSSRLPAQAQIKTFGTESDFTIDGNTLVAYTGRDTEVIVPDGVTVIGPRSFQMAKHVKKVILPAGVVTIDEYAFYQCTGLEEIVFSESLTSIGASAFEGCTGLTGDLIIPNGVTAIAASAFRSCTGLDGKLVLPKLLTRLGNYAFEGCTGITGELILPNTLTRIESAVFRNMTGLTSVVVEGYIPTVSSYEPFRDCLSLETVTFYHETPSNQYLLRGLSDSLKTVYVPTESYDSYVSRYGSVLPSGTQIVAQQPKFTAPTVTLAHLSGKTADLVWDANSSDEIIGYIVLRDGMLVSDTTEHFHVDRDLILGESYVYAVYGYTADGHCTPVSLLTVVPALPTIEDIYTANDQHKVGLSDGTVYIRVKTNGSPLAYAGTKTVGQLFYVRDDARILIGEASVNASLSSDTIAVYALDWHIGDLANGTYTVIFALTDVDGLTTEYSETLTVDRRVPETIINVIAVSDVNVIYLNWAIASEMDTFYRIYRRIGDDGAFTLLAEIENRNTLAYTDRQVENGQYYHYYVTGVNDFGQEGAPSEITVATLDPDIEAPQVTALIPTNGTYLAGTVTFGIRAQDNIAVTRAELYYSLDDGETWTLLLAADKGVFTAPFDTSRIADGKIRVKGVAYDAAGNESTPLSYAFYIDNTGPEKVTELSATTTSVTATLVWSDVADHDIRFYRIEIKNADNTYTTVTDIYNTLGANLRDLIPQTAYTYRVIGYDNLGNRGIPSDDITVTTTADQTAPVISRIRPVSGYYSEQIELTIVASDDYAIQSILIQVSRNGRTWTDLYTEHYTDTKASQTLSYTLALAGYDEGYMYIRAIATDSAGNRSVADETAPFVQHIVDRTEPAAPEGLTASGENGYIELVWLSGKESDLQSYIIYRSTDENGAFEVINSAVSALNFYDRHVVSGATYFYRIAVRDLAGNISALSETVRVTVVADTEAPQILSIYPSTEYKLGADYRTIRVLASDNRTLASLRIEYARNENAFVLLKEITDIGSYNVTVSAQLDLAGFASGDTVRIRVRVTDLAGNTTDSEIVSYTVDLTAPAVTHAAAAFDGNSVILSWHGLAEEDLAGYRIYRRISTSSSYSLIGQKQFAVGSMAYSFADTSLSPEQVTYEYKIVAIDQWGNTAYALCTISLPDRSAPKAVITCESTMEVGVEYYIDATFSTDNSAIVSYFIDFGDGTSTTDKKAIHKYAAEGTYTLTLTVTDDSGLTTTCQKEVTVKSRALLGSVRIRVVSDSGTPVPNASVYFDLGEDTQVIKYTDNQGYAKFTAEVGKHAVGCIIPDNQWLPTKKEIVVTAGAETTVTMTMVKQTLVEGHFEINRMTFDEIVAAGIDVSAPENQYYVRVTVYLQYRQESIAYSFPYNPVTGTQNPSPIVIGERKYYPQAISNYRGEGGSDGGGEVWGGGDSDYRFSKDVSVILFEIPVDVSCLKEFFEVKLHIMNNASAEFSMLDNVITLNVPDGLTIMDTYISEKDAVVKIAEIKGQTTETITWILRGDEVGEYFLTADYSGILSEFNTPIYTEFKAVDPIEVFGLSNLKLYVEVAETLDHANLYYNVSLINEGTLDVYLPQISTDDELIEIELFDEQSRNLLETLGITVSDIQEFGDKYIITSLDGDVGVLKAGYAIRKHYLCVDQSLYSEKMYRLERVWYEMQNSYGLEVEIVVKPLSYFTSYLSADHNPIEKADSILDTAEKRNALAYLMDNENFVYWKLYESQGELMPSQAEQDFWNLLSLDFVELLLEPNADDQVQAIILDAMELSAESSDYALYNKSVAWLKSVEQFTADKDTARDLQNAFGVYGSLLQETFRALSEDQKWEAFRIIRDGRWSSFENFSISKLKELYAAAANADFDESLAAEALRGLFGTDGFATVWESIGYMSDVASEITRVCQETDMDVALFIQAQNNYESCVLFLDALIYFLPYHRIDLICPFPIYVNFHSTTATEYIDDLPLGEQAAVKNDCVQIVRCAEAIKKTLTENDPVKSFFKNWAQGSLEAFCEDAVDRYVDAVAEAAGLTCTGIVAGLKYSLELIVFIGDNVFNVSTRHEVADNIRYVSLMSMAMQDLVSLTGTGYKKNRDSGAAAQNYLEAVGYLLKLRMIGESQVAQLGVTYDVLLGVWDGEPLFREVCDISDIHGVNSWYEWRDVIEDELMLMKVLLFKNPVTTDIAKFDRPIVTFDYAAGQTAQSFGSDFSYTVYHNGEYSERISCDGGPIRVEPREGRVELTVYYDGEDNLYKWTSETIVIYGIPSIQSNGITAVQNAFGYLIDNLDNDKLYEVTFSHTPIEYAYGESLAIQILAGSYSFLYQTAETYEYVYIRAVADAYAYASQVFEPAVRSYESEWDVDVNNGKISNMDVTTDPQTVMDYCNKLGDAVTVTNASGEAADAIGTGYVLKMGESEYRFVVTADVNGDASVDMNDIDAMMSHMNAEEELEGIYREAGCVSGGEEIDLFDIFAAYSRVQADSEQG